MSLLFAYDIDRFCRVIKVGMKPAWVMMRDEVIEP